MGAFTLPPSRLCIKDCTEPGSALLGRKYQISFRKTDFITVTVTETLIKDYDNMSLSGTSALNSSGELISSPKHTGQKSIIELCYNSSKQFITNAFPFSDEPVMELKKQADTMTDHVLQQSWPTFLDEIDSSPNSAKRKFYEFSRKLLKIRPPRYVRSLSEDDLQDFAHDFFMYCCKDNFKTLRKYKDRGSAFAGWLYVVANRKAIDWIRSNTKEPTVSMDNPGKSNRSSGDDTDSLLNFIFDREPGPDIRAGWKDLLEFIYECIEKLAPSYQILLKAAAEGKSPKEIAILVGDPGKSNKAISDDLRYARKKLIDTVMLNASEDTREIFREIISKARKR